MPLQRQAGFIYDSPNMFVIAHELAHGTFNLRHTFSPEELIAAENTTQNLMDYKGGSDLWKHQWELIRDPENMLFAWAQDEREGEYVEEGPISEVARFINTIKCAKNKNLTSVVIHHAFNSYNVKVGDLLEKLNKYRSTNQTTVVSEDFKKAYLKVNIDGGLFSSSTDLYFGYHNFQLSINEYKRNPTQAGKPEELIFSANGKPITFSFPVGVDANIQKDVLDWLERECGITVGGNTFESIRFNVDTDNIKDLFSLSICQLEQINKEDRKKLIEKTLENVENFFGLDKDTYQYLLSNLILSTPKTDVDDLIKYLSSIGGKLESTFLDLTTTAKEVYIYSLCELAKKSWEPTQYLGDINSYYLGSLTLGSSHRQRFGICGTFNLQPGKYEFSYSGWVSDDGIFPSNEPNPQDVYELSAFDPVECNIISDNTKIESKQIMPAIVVKIYAINLHIANIDQLLSIPKMVILPTFSSAVFQGAKRLGQGTVTLIKDITKTFAISTGNLLNKCGKLGYKIKLVGTEVALYTNLNIEIARFSNTGKLIANVYPYNKVGVRLLSIEDEIEYGIAANATKTGRLELAKADDGVVFFREIENRVGTLDDLIVWASNNGLSHLNRTELDDIFRFVDNNLDFAKRIAISTKEIQSANSLSELAGKLNLQINPTARSLSPYQARVWYSWQKAKIEDVLDKTQTLENQAKQALNLRNNIRSGARNSMRDNDIADYLDAKEPNITWDGMVKKKIEDGFKDDDIFREIIKSSMKGRPTVDNVFKIPLVK